MTLASALSLVSGRVSRRADSTNLFSLLFIALMAYVPLSAQSLLIFQPSTPTLLSSSYLVTPAGAAFDSSGDLFVVDYSAACSGETAGALIEYESGSSTPTVLDCNLNLPIAVTVDSSGNLYVADYQAELIYKYRFVSTGSYSKSTIANGTSGFPAADLGHFDSPSGVAVDSSGNIYVADGGDGSGRGIAIAYGGLYVIPYNSGNYGTTYPIGGSTFTNGGVYGVTIDSSGNLYATVSAGVDDVYGDTNATSLYKLTGSGTSWTPHLIDTTYYLATAIAVDPAGNLYVSDDQGDDTVSTAPGAIYKETLVSGTTYTKSSYITSLHFPEDVVIDKNANLYIPDSTAGGGYNPGLYKVNLTTPPTLSNFGSIAIGSDSSAKTVTVTNIGNTALNFSDIAWPADFSASTSNTCTTSVAVNATCDLSIQFSPQSDGLLNEDVTLTDNTKGVTGTEQLIAVSGTGTGSAPATHFSVGAPATAIPNTSFSITITALTASDSTATGYSGIVHFTSSDGSALLPSNSTLTSGVGTFSVTLKTGGSQTVTATDTVTGSINGSATIVVATPSLTVVKSHTGSFTQGQPAIWNIQVSNNGTGATTGATVSVSDTLPAGYTLSSYTGTGWTCSGSTTVSCSSTGVVAGSGGLFPLIALTVNVPNNSAISVTNTAYAWGGGDTQHTNSGSAAISNTDGVTVTQVAATITANSGSTPQSALISTTFANPLAVTVKDANGVVVPSAIVTISSPASGASGVFSNSSNTITATTNSSGVVSEGFTADINSGSYIVTATVAGASTPASFSLTNQAAPTITSANNTTFFAGVPATFTVTSTGYPIATLNQSGTLPTGVTFLDNGNGTASLSGTAALSSGSTYSITITASNSVSPDATQTFTLTVIPIPNFAVTSTSDDSIGNPANCPIPSEGNNCTLRDALAAAAEWGAGNITFSNLPNPTAAQTITLGSAGTLTIPQYTTITGTTSGSGATLTNLVTVNGAATYGVFTINTGVNGTSINNLIITNGYAENGGGINNGGTLTVNNCTISGNTGTVLGAGINNYLGTLTVNNSTISGNIGTGSQGGGINNQGILTLNNSTITGNNAAIGGGIYSNSVSLTVNNSTITTNTSTVIGGGISNDGTLTIGNSIVSGNTAPNNADIFSAGSENDIGGNELGVSVNLAPLDYYGGPTQTMIPLLGSPAICAGQIADIPSGIITDQRGNPRTTTAYGSSCVDSGATQSAYSLSFTASPASTQTIGATLTPSPAVTLYDNGSTINLTGILISIASNAGTLSGTTPQSTNSSGVATFGDLSISPAESNDYLIASATSYGANTITANSSEFNINSISQFITFNPAITTYTYSPGGTFSVSASASSNLTVTFNSLTTGVCSASGTTVSILTAGTCTIQATQIGSTTYSPATPVNVSFNITQITPTLSISNPTVTYNGTAQSAVVVGSVAGTPSSILYNGSSTVPTEAGTYAVTANFTPSDSTDYNSLTATSAGSFTISTAPQSITFTQPTSPVRYGVAPITLSASSTSGLPITFTVTGPATLNGTALTITGAGYVRVTATQAGNSDYAAATSVSHTFLVGKASLTIHATYTSADYNQPIPTLTYTLTGFVNGENASVVTGAPVETTTATQGSAPGNYPIQITAGTLSAANYGGWATQNATLTIKSTPQTITFTQPTSPVRYGVAPITLSANSSSGLPVTLSVVGPATLNGTALTITGIGTVVIRANQAGNSDYAAANQVVKEIIVDRADLTIHATYVSVGYNQPIPTLTYTVTGFVNGENASVLTGAPVESTTATQGSAPGYYPIQITAGTLSAANYGGWATMNGTLTITK